MIRIKPTLTLGLIAVTFAAVVQCADERMRAGLWEVTTTEGKQSSSLGKTCYTPAMVETANLPKDKMRERTEQMFTKRGCTMKDFKIDGNKMSMSNVCPNSSAVIWSTYNGDAFETVDTRTMNGVTKVIHMQGRRVGDCK